MTYTYASMYIMYDKYSHAHTSLAAVAQIGQYVIRDEFLYAHLLGFN